VRSSGPRQTGQEPQEGRSSTMGRGIYGAAGRPASAFRGGAPARGRGRR
jgi:hypothetical protein